MLRRLPLTLLLAAGAFASTAARAELVHFKYSSLKRVEDKRICLTFAHEKVETAPKSQTNTAEAIECRVRVWPELLGKAETQTYDERDVYQTGWAVYQQGEKKEQCFDFGSRLAPDDKIVDLGRLTIRCAPRSRSDRIFAKAEGRPKSYDEGLLASVSSLITKLWRN